MADETQRNPSREEIETSKLVAEMINLMTETRKMQTETLKIASEIRWYPLVVGAGILGAGAALAKLFMR